MQELVHINKKDEKKKNARLRQGFSWDSNPHRTVRDTIFEIFKRSNPTTKLTSVFRNHITWLYSNRESTLHNLCKPSVINILINTLGASYSFKRLYSLVYTLK